MNHKRLRDWGVVIGSMQPGPLNKITDVPGVLVGHHTLIDEYHRTGVTVIIPADGNLFTEKLTATSYVINGFGKTEGTVQLEELGTLETPIALTGTLDTGKMADALVSYTLDRCAAEGVDCRSVNPVVGETNDGLLGRTPDRPMGYSHLCAAIGAAVRDFDEGDVGAGAGTTCLGCKGGIGSASRTVDLGDDGKFTVGVLVQSNFGHPQDLIVGGYPLGRDIDAKKCVPVHQQGSIMIVVGTDLPLSVLQLRRILKRVPAGLARVGSYIGHGSGDVAIGFTTANRRRVSDTNVRTERVLNDSRMNDAFRAVIESTEEAVLNSLVCADTVTAKNGKFNPDGTEQVLTAVSLNEYMPYLVKKTGLCAD